MFSPSSWTMSNGLCSPKPSLPPTAVVSPLVGDSQTRRQQMYKLTTPPWRDAFRKRCTDRLKQNRERLVNLSRRHLQSTPYAAGANGNSDTVMREEWASFATSSGLSANDHEAFLAIYEELQRELQEEEARILEQFSVECAEFEAQTVAALEQSPPADESQVLCPSCLQHALEIVPEQRLIHCPACQLRIHTESLTSWNAEELKTLISSAIDAHLVTSPGCPATGPSVNFHSSWTGAGMQQLVMDCVNCAFHHVVF